LSRLASPVNRELQCTIIEITALYRITALYCTSRLTGNARRDNSIRYKLNDRSASGAVERHVTQTDESDVNGLGNRMVSASENSAG